MDLDVVWEDEHLLVVDKPAGVVVHPGTGHQRGTLVHGLLGHDVAGGDEDRPGIVHRLDRDTSGLLVVARSDEAHSRLQELIRRRAVERRYLTLVKGTPRSRTGRIEAPIGRDRLDKTRHSLDTATPRDAVTHFEVVELLGPRALLELRLETGRTHQIRVHLEAIELLISGRPGLRLRRRPRARAAVPARGRAGIRPPVHRRPGRGRVAAARRPRRRARARPRSGLDPRPVRPPSARDVSGDCPRTCPGTAGEIATIQQRFLHRREPPLHFRRPVPSPRRPGRVEGAALCERFHPRPAGCTAINRERGQSLGSRIHA